MKRIKPTVNRKTHKNVAMSEGFALNTEIRPHPYAPSRKKALQVLAYLDRANNERLCAVEPRLRLKRFCLEQARTWNR